MEMFQASSHTLTLSQWAASL